MACTIYTRRGTNGRSSDPAADAAECLAIARRALSLGRRNPMVLAHAGWALVVFGDSLEEGAHYLNESVLLDPNLFLGWSWSGWASLYLGDIEPAIERFQRALRQSPADFHSFIPLCGLAFTYFLSGDLQHAVGWAESAHRQRPDFLWCAVILAASYAMVGRREDAERARRIVLQLRPDFKIPPEEKFGYRLKHHREKLRAGYLSAGLPE